MKHIFFRKGFILLSTMFLIACSYQNDKKLEQALTRAKENRHELEKVLNHYKNDPQKLAATRFLIENMPYHFTQEHDSAETQYKLDLLALDSCFLVDNIELAFAVWQKPWARNVPFEDFCRYILPYRAHSEEVSILRREIMERFVPLLDSARVKTPLEACMVLNEQLKKVMKYEKTASSYATIDETYRSGIGLCEALCELGTFIMRACGIPTTLEQTTWTKMDLGHSWCAVFDNGRFYTFGPGEDNPGIHARIFSKNTYLHPAKVYRSRFDPDFSKTNKNDDNYYTALKNPLLYDVTDQYPDKTTKIQVVVDKKSIETGKSDQIYLCAYNHYEWYPLAIGKRKDSICYFENVVGNNIFIIADSPDGVGLRYITAPFLLDRRGIIHKFIPVKDQIQTFTLSKRKGELNKKHTLYYWDTSKSRFTSLDYASATDTTQTYDHIPRNALLWFIIPEKIINQRICFIKNDSLLIH